LAAYQRAAVPTVPLLQLAPLRPLLPHNADIVRAVAAFHRASEEQPDCYADVLSGLDHLRRLSLGVESEADELARTGRADEAIAAYQGYLAHQERSLREGGPDQVRLEEIEIARAENRHKLGRLYLRYGRRVEAAELWRAALPEYRRLFGQRHPDTLAIEQALREIDEDR
jgi:hypothetical protein